MIATLEIQKSLFTALSGDSTLTALIPADHIVDAIDLPDLPALRIGDIVEGASGLTLYDDHMRLVVTLHAFTRETGKLENATILKRIRDVTLNDWKPTLAGFALNDFRFDSVRFMRDGADPAICHGVLSFDALVEVAP